MHVQRIIIASFLMQFVISCGGGPSFGVESEISDQLSKLPGKIFLGFKTSKRSWNFSLDNGKLLEINAFPEQPNSVNVENFKIDNLPFESDMHYRGPYLVSADKSLVVAGIEYKGANLYLSSDFIIADLKEKKILFKSKSKEPRIIEKIAWSPDSKYFAIIQKSEKSLFSLKNILSSMVGHPVRSNIYYLKIYDRLGQIYGQSEIASGLIGSYVELLWSAKEKKL